RGEHIDGFERWLESHGLTPLHRHAVLAKPITCLRIAAAEFPSLLDGGLCDRLRYVSAQSAGRSRPRDAYSPFVARQLRSAARTDIAIIRARFDKPQDIDTDTAKRWEAVDNLIKNDGMVSHTHP